MIENNPLDVNRLFGRNVPEWKTPPSARNAEELPQAAEGRALQPAKADGKYSSGMAAAVGNEIYLLLPGSETVKVNSRKDDVTALLCYGNLMDASGGVVRYTGTDNEVMLTNYKPLPTGVTSMCEHGGSMWVGMKKGATGEVRAVVKKGKFDWEGEATGKPVDSICSHRGELHFATADGIFKKNAKSKKPVCFAEFDSRTGPAICSFEPNPYGGASLHLAYDSNEIVSWSQDRGVPEGPNRVAWISGNHRALSLCPHQGVLYYGDDFGRIYDAYHNSSTRWNFKGRKLYDKKPVNALASLSAEEWKRFMGELGVC